MAGLLPGRSVMSERLTLGYRRARVPHSSWLFEAGEEIRGHEFHYSQWEGRPPGVPAAYALLTPRGNGEPWSEGAHDGAVFASYVHVHFWGKPELAKRFVKACQLLPVGAKAGAS